MSELVETKFIKKGTRRGYSRILILEEFSSP